MSNPTRTISSQRYLDHEIVEAKRRARDYAAQRATVTVDGEAVYVVVDGHHSLRAAKLDNGGEIAWEPCADEIQRDATRASQDGTILDWMAAHQGDSDWYDIATGRDAW